MILKQVASILEKLGYPSTTSSATFEIASDRLIAVLGSDSKGRENVLVISPLTAKIEEKNELRESQSLFRIEFRALFPFKCRDEYLNEVAHLLFFLTPYLALPGFDLNELEGEIAYRYVWLTNENLIHQESLTTIIGSSLLAFHLYGDLIESVATGQKTFNQVLKAIVETVEKDFEIS